MGFPMIAGRDINTRCGLVMLLLLVGCDDRGGGSGKPISTATPSASAPAGMRRFAYLAADGGPHMLLPTDVAPSWSGVPSMLGAIDPRSDYGRACAATASDKMAMITVGSGRAVVFANPPMTAWGKSSDGLLDICYLDSWTSTDLDSLIDKATAALPTASLRDSGKKLKLIAPDAFLLFAGDTTDPRPTGAAYGVHRVPLGAGAYRILVGTYSSRGESVTVYRFQPMTP